MKFEQPKFPPADEEALPQKQYTRRGFLKFMGAAAGVLAAKRLEAGVGGLAKPEINQSILKKPAIEDQIRIERSEQKKKVEVTPEYDRKLERILLSMPTRNKEKDDELEHKKLIYRTFHDLLIKLPAYSQIEIIVNENEADYAKEVLRVLELECEDGVRLLDRVNWHLIKEDTEVDQWAQDFGEAIKTNGRENFLIPMEFDEKKFFPKDVKRNRARKKLLKEYFSGPDTIQADFYFDGGNVSFDQTPSGLRVFIGYNDIFYTVANYQAKGINISLEEAAKKVSRQFGGAEIIVMGNKEQKDVCYHIDQSFVMLGGGVAAMSQCTDNPQSPVAKQLRYQKSQLESLGYKIIEIGHSLEELENSYTSVNAIPFIDKITGERKIIFPVFPGEISPDKYNKKVIDEADLQGKASSAFIAYKSAGYMPIPVRDYANINKGNTHCISNVLAGLENKSKIAA